MNSLYENDKSTIFSIVPFTIHETKPGLYPGIFHIDACLDDRQPERLLVGASKHMMYIAGKKQPIAIDTASYQIAKAIVDDFLDGQLHTTPDARPGICWIQGDVPVGDFVSKNIQIFNQLKATQRKWLILQVQKTEDDWKKYHHSRVVTDQARFAVRALGLPIPEWMTNEEVGMNFVKCPACSTMNDPNNVVCSGCTAVFTADLMKATTKEEKLKHLTFAK